MSQGPLCPNLSILLCTAPVRITPSITYFAQILNFHWLRGVVFKQILHGNLISHKIKVCHKIIAKCLFCVIQVGHG